MSEFEVLLASDFTARSDRPLDRAVQLAQDRAGALVVAHIVETGSEFEPEALTRRLKAHLPPAAADAQLVISAGSVPKEVATLATERGSDVIVTGVARYNSIGDFFLGTAVDQIIRNAQQPVLVVRRRPDAPYQRLLVATDLSDCSREALAVAARLFPDAAITLVHAFHIPYEGWFKSEGLISDVETEAREKLDQFRTRLQPALAARIGEVRLVQGETGTIVAQEIERTGADLLVLGTHGRSGFMHATIGSQAEALLASVTVDVLMVRERI